MNLIDLSLRWIYCNCHNYVDYTVVRHNYALIVHGYVNLFDGSERIAKTSALSEAPTIPSAECAEYPLLKNL